MNTLQNTLVEQYMEFADRLACKKKRTLPSYIDIEDLRSAAYLGLVEAASRYDSLKGVKFQTFAYTRIWGAIHDYLREQIEGSKSEPITKYSLDYTNQDDELSPKDMISVEESNQDEIFEVFAEGLSEQSKAALRFYYFECWSMKEIGKALDVSEGRVSQIINGCKKSISHKYNLEELQELLAA